ncbi:MAG: cupin domain-containing protein [Candidatus Lokiarchaeota archaeon]|nr:cupin domain-containing protein [Candidatus Lokiarchaeota archaeon]
MKKINANEVQVKDNPHNVAARTIYSFEHATIVHITLNPGETLKKHVTPVDAIFYGLEGEGMVEIGEEMQKMNKDDLVFSPKNKVHRLYNESSTPFKILVIKTPSPKNQKTKIL